MPRKSIKSLKIGDSPEFLKGGILELNARAVQNEFFEGLFKESDRSAIIVGSSYLEELTRRKLVHILNKGNTKSRDALFNGTGPLSTFSARINLLYCMGEISADAAADLNNLRKLRNHCAHTWETFLFNENVENEYLSKFRNYLNLSNTTSLSEYVPRTQFLLVCAHYVTSVNFHEMKS